MELFILILIVVGLIAFVIYPIIFSVRFKNEYGKMPVSGFGLLLQVASVISLFAEYTEEVPDKTRLMWAYVLLAGCVIVGCIIAAVKTAKLGGSKGQIFLAVYSQLFFILYVLLIIIYLLGRDKNKNKRVF